MPKWVHDRAKHIEAKNPSMPESEAFAIATQQAHAIGKSPKGYGTPMGRHVAKEKYDDPKSTYDTRANGEASHVKEASFTNIRYLDLALVKGFSDELQKITNILQPQPGDIKTTTALKDTHRPGVIQNYSKANTSVDSSPIAKSQPVLAAPAVRT
jgi:hypothetical protein